MSTKKDMRRADLSKVARAEFLLVKANLPPSNPISDAPREGKRQ
jgi:hypothetical protein